MDVLGPLAGGIGLLANPTILLLLLMGTMLGVVVGALPGLGSTLAFGMVLPFTFGMQPVESVAMLLSISVGVGLGNSLPSILVGVPGTPAAILTVIDGHKLHKAGKTGLAMATAYLGAVIGQGLSSIAFVVVVVPLSGLAFLFLQPEQFGLYLFGIVAIVTLTGKNVVKGFLAGGLGLAIGFVGLDPVNSVPRFTFGVQALREGISVAAVLIGLLAVSELIRQARQHFQWDKISSDFTMPFPIAAELRPIARPILIGTVAGTLIGPIPGAGGSVSTVISYQLARSISKHPEEFGNGSIEGLAANEAAQNADKSGELIPTLALGIPGSSAMVLLLAALTINGFIPGPNMIPNNPELLHAAVAGLLGATIVMLVTGWWLSKLVLKALTFNRSMIIVFALFITLLGVYSLSYRILDVFVAMTAGVVGYFMTRYGYTVGAAGLAVVLSAGLESNLRRGLGINNNDIVQFLSRPITALIVFLALVFFIIGLRQTLRQGKEGSGEVLAVADQMVANDPTLGPAIAAEAEEASDRPG